MLAVALHHTYLWNDPLNQITGTATGLCMGLYSVTVTDANGCTSTGSVYVDDTPSGIPPINFDDIINIYPNPSTGYVNIEFVFSKLEDVRIFIFNTIGEIVYSEKLKNLSTGICTIDLSEKANGIYFIHILTENAVLVKRISLVH
ncbi:MAG: T9SS type A sorting domain-containing protein [Bacteroidota bacterium]